MKRVNFQFHLIFVLFLTVFSCQSPEFEKQAETTTNPDINKKADLPKPTEGIVDFSDFKKKNINFFDYNKSCKKEAEEKAKYECLPKIGVSLGDEYEIVLTKMPDGMMIDKKTGKITWRPSNTQIGEQYVEVSIVKPLEVFKDHFSILVTNVNLGPLIIGNDCKGSIFEDVVYNCTILAVDEENDTLSYTIDGRPVTMKIDNKGKITWIPDQEDIGDRKYQIKVSDGKDWTNDYMEFEVLPLNDSPKFTSDCSKTAKEDTLYKCSLTASDSDSDDHLFSLLYGPEKMVLKNGNTIEWTPDLKDVGKTYFEVIVEDYNGGMSSKRYDLTVEAVNDNPVITTLKCPAEADEDKKYNCQIMATDEENDAISFEIVTASSPSGMAVNSSGLISWTPTQQQLGDKNFTVRAKDIKGGKSEQKYSVKVFNTNDAPLITSPATLPEATEDSQYVYQVTYSDEDVSSTITYSLLQKPSGMSITESGEIHWLPLQEHVNLGNNTLKVKVEDESEGSSTKELIIKVKNVNDAPVVTSDWFPPKAAEGHLYSFKIQYSDEDGDAIVFSLLEKPQGMTVSLDGTISWTPNQDQGCHPPTNIVCTYPVTIKIADIKGSFDEVSWDITVVDVNSDPILSALPCDSATNEDELFSCSANATDPDGDDLSYQLIFPNQNKPTGMAINANSGEITWTPAQINSGKTYTYIVRVYDEVGAYDEESKDLQVSNVNDEPVLTDVICPGTIEEDSSYSCDLEYQDQDGDPVSFSLGIKPSGMTIDALTGVIMWTPLQTHVGENSFTVNISDGKGGSGNKTFQITVLNVNDAPVITNSCNAVAMEDHEYTCQLQYDDEDGDSQNFTLITKPDGMTINSSGLVVWVPEVNQLGATSFKVKIDDGHEKTAEKSFSLTVGEYNDPHTVLPAATLYVSFDATFNHQIEIEDEENGGFSASNKVKYYVVSGPAGLIIDSSTGMVTWPYANEPRYSADFTIRAADNENSDTQTFHVDVYDNITFGTVDDWNGGTINNLNVYNDENDDGSLQLASVLAQDYNYACIANSGENGVLLLSTKDGTNIAKNLAVDNINIKNSGNGSLANKQLFITGTSPSRTAIDVDGNCWVANREGSSPNGTIGHKTDLTKIEVVIDPGTGLISSYKIYDIVFPSYTDGYARSISVDKNGNIWAGDWNHNRIIKIPKNIPLITRTKGVGGNNILAADQVKVFSLGGFKSYGSAIDSNGILWTSNRGGGGVTRIDTNLDNPPVSNCPVTNYGITNNLYGIAIDKDNNVWLGNYTTNDLIKVSTTGVANPTGASCEGVTGMKPHDSSNSCTGSRGVTVDAFNRVYTACSSSSSVLSMKLDGSDKKSINVGSGPIGISASTDGKIWAVNYNSKTVSIIDGATFTIGATYTVGNDAYTYSDFMGYGLKSVTLKDGFWKKRLSAKSDNPIWYFIEWQEEIPENTWIKKFVRCSASEDLLNLPEDNVNAPKWIEIPGPVQDGNLCNDPEGDNSKWIELKIALGMNDGAPAVPKFFEVSFKYR